MTGPLSSRVALVTGGSRGIGRAIAVSLAAAGARVLVNYASREDAAEATCEHIRQAGGDAVPIGFDVSDPVQTSAAIKSAAREHGGLDILINNAGIARNGLLLRVRDEDLARTIDINLKGALHCTRAAASALLKSREHGRVLQLSSVVGETGNPGQSVYAATKAGLIGMTKALAREFAGRGVCVNAIAPGYIDTDMTRAELPDEQRASLLDRIPLGRIGTPEEVADVVTFLAGPGGRYITGQIIRVNGGLLM